MTAVPRRPSSLLIAVFALSLAAACGDDSLNGVPTIGATSADGLTITIDTGSNLQLAVVGSTIRVSVRATNRDGSAAPGLTALWTVQSGGGTLAAASGTTDANGIAQMAWTLGTAAGKNSIAVAISGAAVTISATAAAGPLTSLIKVSRDPEIVAPTSSSALVVRAVDQFGNGIPGVVITWGATSGTLAPATTTTGDAGNAQVTFTTNAAPTIYLITASAPGVASVTFTLTSS